MKCEEEAEPAPAKQNREGEGLRKVKLKIWSQTSKLPSKRSQNRPGRGKVIEKESITPGCLPERKGNSMP